MSSHTILDSTSEAHDLFTASLERATSAELIEACADRIDAVRSKNSHLAEYLAEITLPYARRLERADPEINAHPGDVRPLGDDPAELKTDLKYRVLIIDHCTDPLFAKSFLADMKGYQQSLVADMRPTWEAMGSPRKGSFSGMESLNDPRLSAMRLATADYYDRIRTFNTISIAYDQAVINAKPK